MQMEEVFSMPCHSVLGIRHARISKTLPVVSLRPLLQAVSVAKSIINSFNSIDIPVSNVTVKEFLIHSSVSDMAWFFREKLTKLHCHFT